MIALCEAPSSADGGAFFFRAARALLRAVCACAGAAVAVSAAAQSGGGDRPDVSAAAAQVVQKTNAFRTAQGLSALEQNAALADAAQRFAEYMAETGKYGHEADDRKPAERARERGYEYCMVAENIAYQFSSAGFATADLAARFVDGWINSPGHRRNMLLPQVVDIGVGVARSSGAERYYAVQMFGRPRSASLRFEIANRADAAVRYALGDESFTLPPRVTRTHHGCFDGEIRMQWSEGAASPGFAPRNGARYTVVRDHAGQLRLQTQ